MASVIQDRPYQVTAEIGTFETWGGGDAAALGLLPTGCGKTVVGGRIFRRAIDDYGRRGLFLAHREELIVQAAATFERFGLRVGVEMAEQRSDTMSLLVGARPDVVVGTVQSLQRKRLQRRDPHEFGVIITDEAHHARAAVLSAGILRALPATPATSASPRRPTAATA
jgi:superfamily II DNA or RNA helicase